MSDVSTSLKGTPAADVRKSVATQLRVNAEAVFSSASPKTSEALLKELAEDWERYYRGILINMLHTYSRETGSEDRLYSPIVVTWAASELRTSRYLLPFWKLPIGDDNDDGPMISTWTDFFRHFLDGEDLAWFNSLVKDHDDWRLAPE